MTLQDVNLALPTGSSVVAAQALSAAVATAYGFAFIGLWLQFRRPSMVVLARAWLLFGAFSASTPIFSDAMLGLAPSSVVDAVTFALAMLTVTAFLDAALVIAGRRGLRTYALTVGIGASAITALGLLLQVDWITVAMRGVGLRTFALLFTASAMVAVLTARMFPGRRYLAVGLGFLLVRFGVGFVLEIFRPGQLLASEQPSAFTIIQLLTLTLAGYYMTATAFAQEHAGTMRERIELERRLGRGQRLQSIGRVAGSVAHDFNNVLTAALGATEELADPQVTAKDRDEAIEALQAAVARGKALTQQLLEFSRPDRGAVETFDPGTRLTELIPMMRRLVGEPVRVELQPPAPGAPLDGLVRANPVQFDQVLLNLAANARDAMPTGGTLRIACHMDARADARLPGGSRVRILFADTGTGMSAEVAEHVFDPYFTTKPGGKGTGLGLATAFAFARHSGGDLSVESAPGAGATFTLTLPLERGA